MIAPVVLQALGTILNALPIAYMIRIDTSDSQVYQISGSGAGAPQQVPAVDERTNGWRLQPRDVRGF